MTSPNNAYQLHGTDMFGNILDDPFSLHSSFHQLHRLFNRIACAIEPMEVVDNLSAFIKAILLTSIIHDDLTVVTTENFLDLCCAADRLADCAPVPGMEPWTWSEADAFFLNAPNFSQYWTDVALFQRNRANIIDACSDLMTDHESRLKDQTCRMYDPGNLDEADGLRSLLQFLDHTCNFNARSYVKGRFGDIISHQKLPCLQDEHCSSSSSNSSVQSKPNVECSTKQSLTHPTQMAK